jgi:hypothetical protein
MVMDLDGAIHSDLDIWIRGFGLVDLAWSFGWNNPYYGYNNMVVKDITETTTMQVEEVQLTPMITRIGILVLETTTITTKLIEAITVEILIITLLETTTITK